MQGASGGGGNNYTGSKSSFDNYTACPAQGSPVTQRTGSTMPPVEEKQVPDAEVIINPNPAADHINLSFVPLHSGVSKIEVYTISGGKVLEIDYGMCEAGNKYRKKIDVSKLVNGVYLVRVWNSGKSTNKKIVISR